MESFPARNKKTVTFSFLTHQVAPDSEETFSAFSFEH